MDLRPDRNQRALPGLLVIKQLSLLNRSISGNLKTKLSLAKR